MGRFVSLLALLLASTPLNAQDRAVVDASAPENLAVTIYRDPGRPVDGEMDRDWPQGFAMISETRRVILPAGRSTIRFEGVAEGMVAVSAIVTGLPGGVIEQNRNANLLSPAALVDGTLGNRVRITRTNPATGAEAAEQAIIRTRADGGLVLQTDAGFEAVRCSGLPERLTFDAIPASLSAAPVFSIDTADETGGTYEVTLTYLAWGFDWQANYVATLQEGRRADDVRLRLMSWLTLLNDNGQSFAGAELMVIAGTLNVVSDFRRLAQPPQARPLNLTCYPLGSTAAGSPVPDYGREEWDSVAEESITVTAMRMPSAIPPPPSAPAMAMAMPAPAMVAEEEQLGDLKLYRVPERVTVSAKGLKQVAFLDQDAVRGRLLYAAQCSPWDDSDAPGEAGIILATKNDAAHGLGMALPSGNMTFFEQGARGEQLVARQNLRDYAEGQDVEIDLGQSSQVFVTCENDDGASAYESGERWVRLRATITNANPQPVNLRLDLGSPAEWVVRLQGSFVKDGQHRRETTVRGNSRQRIEWQVRRAD